MSNVPKFRLWDKKRKSMVYGNIQKIDFVSGTVHYADIFIDDSDSLVRTMPMAGYKPVVCKFDDVIFMQSTGLKDRNGTEIYEGDIVHIHHFVGKYHPISLGFIEDEVEVIGILRYGRTTIEKNYYGNVYPPGWYLEKPNEEYELNSFEGLHEESFTVIGNTLENTELLKK